MKIRETDSLIEIIADPGMVLIDMDDPDNPYIIGTIVYLPKGTDLSTIIEVREEDVPIIPEVPDEPIE